MELQPDMFASEMAAALKSYDRHVVCIEKIPEDCSASLASLMSKAIKAYENRGPSMRHGIALDRHLTIILSQSEGDLPMCGIYFNLHSPYSRKPATKLTKNP